MYSRGLFFEALSWVSSLFQGISDAVVRPRGYVFLAVMGAVKLAPVEDFDLLSAEPTPAILELFFSHIQVSIKIYLIFNLY
jgi:hypothetical protein